MKVCGKCRTTRYCSREHQVAHWKNGHKKECKVLKATPEPVQKLSALLNSARSKVRKGELNQARKVAESAFTYACEHTAEIQNPAKYQVLALREVAKCQGDIEAIRTTWKKALSIAENSQCQESTAICHMHMALHYYGVEKFDRASEAIKKCNVEAIESPDDYSFYIRTYVVIATWEDQSTAEQKAEDFLDTCENTPKWHKCAPTALLMCCVVHYQLAESMAHRPHTSMAQMNVQGLVMKRHFERCIEFAERGIAAMEKEPEYMDTYIMKDLLLKAAHGYFQRMNKAKFTEYCQKFHKFVRDKCVQPARAELETLKIFEQRIKLLP